MSRDSSDFCDHDRARLHVDQIPPFEQFTLSMTNKMYRSTLPSEQQLALSCNGVSKPQ